jgi:hypothetical protein
LVFTGQTVVAEIINPTAQPPDKNTAGYLEISDLDQAKQGPLRLGTNDIASQFNYQLEVLGEGADLSNANIDNNYSTIQTVSGNLQTQITNNLTTLANISGAKHSAIITTNSDEIPKIISIIRGL